jgi:hypothetical protein
MDGTLALLSCFFEFPEVGTRMSKTGRGRRSFQMARRRKGDKVEEGLLIWERFFKKLKEK